MNLQENNLCQVNTSDSMFKVEECISFSIVRCGNKKSDFFYGSDCKTKRSYIYLFGEKLTLQKKNFQKAIE